IKQELVDNTTASVERGNFGSPTFFVKERMWFGKDRLRDVEEAILAARAA
ncbi:MAG TPA: disulfide bond formation protein DsbA, partial [Hyphomonas sp.]|nr:disulfide bond formation protein DsbA [Hyphomonas sp.]